MVVPSLETAGGGVGRGLLELSTSMKAPKCEAIL